MRLRLLCLIVVAAVTAGACKGYTPSGPGVVTITEAYSISITPKSATINVGQTLQLVATTTGNPIPAVSWTSSNPAIGPVTSAGLVTCLVAGAVTITGRTSIAGAESTASVTCAATISLELTPAQLTLVHIVGESPCPDLVGTVTVTSASSVDVQVAFALPSTLAVEPATFTLAPGASRSVTVRFNCSTQTSFTGAVTFLATNGGLTETKNLPVSVTIIR